MSKTNLYSEQLQNNWKGTNLESIVSNAGETFKTLGIPTKKLEDWKYTNPSDALIDSVNTPTETSDITIDNFVIDKSNTLVINNGKIDHILSKVDSNISFSVYSPEKSDLSNEQLALLKSNHIDAFDALNTATMSEIIFVNIDDNKSLESPLSIAHIAADKNKNYSPRVIVTIGKFSKATVVETFDATTDEKYQRDAITNILVGESANLTHIKVQNESKASFHYGKVEASLKKDSNFTSLTFNTGANVARNNIHVYLNEIGATANVHGLFALREEQHADNFSQIHHNVEKTYSDQLFKGILADTSHGIFTGKIVVHRDAQEIDSSQLSKNLLLSKKAHIHTRPQLEVYADDVKCAHGATVGQISEDEVFYLESRGISKERAQKILGHAFAAEAIEKIEDQSARHFLSKLLFENFEKFTIGEEIDS